MGRWSNILSLDGDVVEAFGKKDIDAIATSSLVGEAGQKEAVVDAALKVEIIFWVHRKIVNTESCLFLFRIKVKDLVIRVSYNVDNARKEDKLAIGILDIPPEVSIDIKYLCGYLLPL